MKIRSVHGVFAVSGLALILSGCATKGNDSGSSVSSSGSSSMTSSTSSELKSDSSFKDGVLVTPEMEIKITGHRIIPVGKKGNEYGKKSVLAFWYKITNLTEKKISPMDFLYVITAYQDNNPNAENKLNVGSLPDDKFLDSQTENIKKGGTVENAIAYELDDTSTPVGLVASTDLGQTEIGRVTYSLK